MADQIPLPSPWPQPQSPEIGGNPIALSPGTYARHERAVRYVELMTRELPFTPRRGRTTTPASGVWGYVQPGKVITGIYGLTLGEGQMVICSRDGPHLTTDGDTVTVYNSGRRFKAGPNGAVFALTWMDGNWWPQIPNFGVGIANGDITPRGTGDFGAGLVDLYESSFTTEYYYYGEYGGGTPVGPLDTVEVSNASATLTTLGNGIDSGTWCSVAWDHLGVAWAAPLECPT